MTRDKTRVQAFVDGFNLYHAIDRLADKTLLWVDLWSLMKQFIGAEHDLTSVVYFSAFATHRGSVVERHRQYVKALEHVGVTCVMGRFQEKASRCRRCGNQWTRHEEKETDVNLAIAIVEGAYCQRFDECFIVSRDSDLAPAIRAVKRMPTPRSVKIIAPPNLGHSKELAQLADRRATIKRVHLERNLLPDRAVDGRGREVFRRPRPYAIGSVGDSKS